MTGENNDCLKFGDQTSFNEWFKELEEAFGSKDSSANSETLAGVISAFNECLTDANVNELFKGQNATSLLDGFNKVYNSMKEYFEELSKGLEETTSQVVADVTEYKKKTGYGELTPITIEMSLPTFAAFEYTADTSAELSISASVVEGIKNQMDAVQAKLENAYNNIMEILNKIGGESSTFGGPYGDNYRKAIVENLDKSFPEVNGDLDAIQQKLGDVAAATATIASKDVTL